MDDGPRTDAPGGVDLTQGQRLLWVGQQLHPDAPLYNMAFTFVIDGAIDPALFEQVFRLLVARDDTLRSVVTCPDDVPQQQVRESVEDALAVLDMSGDPDPEGAFAAWAQQRCETRIDLERRSFESALVKLGDERWGWFLNQHHVTSDAWGAGVIYGWIRDAYEQLRRGEREEDLPALPSYEAYRAFEAKVRAEATERTRVSSSPAAPLYGRHRRRPGTANERVRVPLGAARLERLRELAMRPEAAGLTIDLGLFRLVATALFAYLHRVSGQESLRVGALSHNRSTQAFKRTIGLFTELYPLGVDVGPDDTFVDLLAKSRDASDSFLRAAQPGGSDAAASRSVNTVLNFIRGDFGPFDGSPVHATWLHPRHVDAEHHLRVQVHDFTGSGALTLELDFNVDVFDEAQRRGAIDHFLRILDAMLDDWTQPVAGVPLIDPGSASTLYPPGPAVDAREPGTVVEMFREHVGRDPDATAIVCGDRRLSYADLDHRARALAGALRTRGAGPGTNIGVCAGRSAEAVTAMLATLMAGAAYVPMDPHWPAARLRMFVEDAGLALVLHRAGQVPEGLSETSLLAVCVDDELPASSAALPAPSGETLAYILYTSGSTGRPKGVQVEHRSLANYVGWARDFYSPGERLAFPLFSPLTFDLTVTSILVPLASGGSIVVYPETDPRADMAVLRVFDDDAVDIVKLTPSHLSLLADRDLAGTRVRQLILGGEDLTERLARRISQQFGGRVRIHNEYGPTEATVGCIVHTYDPSRDVGGSVPIGRPIRGARAFVVDARGNPVPTGVVGELAIAGAGLARGYHGRPELTAERFVRPSPLDPGGVYLTGDLARRRDDGVIEYLGRRDGQVKVRGVRIELGEVEAALAGHPDVTTCVVDVYHRAEPVAPGAALHCARCGLASNYPGVSFDGERVCNHCRAFDEYRQRATSYFRPMDELHGIFKASSRARPDAEYDCLALLSGGKDSTYVLGRLVDMGLRVLTFTLDNGYISEQAKANIRRVVETLGVDHVFGSTPAMNEIFVDSLERHANVCHGCFKTIYTLSLELAREKGIPIIVTGLSRGQFFETRLTEELFTDLTASVDDIDRVVLEARKAYHRIDDAVHRLMDVSMFDDDRIFDEVQFVDFYRYCDVDLEDLYGYLDERLPWVRPSDTGRSTNCLINDVGIYIHKRDRGFHNYALPYSWDVRMGHKTRGAALDELDDEIDVEAVQRILHEIGYAGETSPDTPDGRLVAYYVADEELTATELRRHVAARLPDALVPTRFVRIDAIPVTTHGKVDRGALPDPAATRSPAADTPYLAPRTPVEEALCEIWSAVLGVDRVGVHDNFFDLGGDSIMAIQIVAQAHRRGLRLTAGDLFESLTVETLAGACGSGATEGAERIAGPIDLLPAQHWFFDVAASAPGHWNQAVRVTLPSGVDESVLRRALATVTEHHDAFRISFAMSDGAWLAEVGADPVDPALRRVDVTGLAETPRRTVVDRIEHELHGGFDIGSAPLLAGAVFVDAGRPVELLLVAHHLVVDAVSWSVLLDDLELACELIASERPVALPPVATSPRAWAEALHDAARAGSVHDEHAYWRGMVEKCTAAALPAPACTGTLGASETIRVELDAARTETLLRAVARTARVQPNELVIASLAFAIGQWREHRDVALVMEGHGREPIDGAMELSRAVGWFTSLFPVVVQLPEDDRDAFALVRTVKDQLRAVPQRGLGYGVLRFLDPDARRRASLVLDGRDQVLFNYLGDVSRLRPADAPMQVQGALRLDRAGTLHRPFALEINAMVVDGVLQIDWEHDPARHDRTAIEPVARACVEHLGRLIDACAAEGGTASGSDFPLANLDDDKLRKLSSLLDKGRKR